MADSFDPYHVWLGIPRDRRPPTHYQLLAISPDEQDRAVINAAVTRQSAYVRNFQVGKHGADAARILGEIQAAKICLLDPTKRASYDAQHQREAPATAPPAGIAFDLDALAGASAPAIPATRSRRPSPRLQTFSNQKSALPWQLPLAGLAIAVLIVVVLGFAMSRRDEQPTVENQSAEHPPQQERKRHAEPTPSLVAGERQPASAAARTGAPIPPTAAKATKPIESSQDQPPTGPLSLVTDASRERKTPGELAEPPKTNTIPPAPPSKEAAGGGNSVDLLSLIDLDRDLLSGEWKFDGRGLAALANTVAQCELPVNAPDEYVLTVVVEGRPQARELLLGLPIAGHPAWLRIDGYAGTFTNLIGVDGQDDDHNPTAVRGRIMRDDGPNTIVCTVRRDGLRLECNGRTAIDWRGDPARIKTDDFPARLGNDLILQSWNNACRVTRLELTATSPADWRPEMPDRAKTAKKPSKPDGNKLRIARRTVDSTFNKPLRQAKNATDRWNVIERMREQGEQTYDDTALQYTLFDQARERATAMGQVATACHAIEDLGRVFNIDKPAAKEEAVLTGLLKTSTPKQLVTGAMVALLVADRAMTSGDLDRAEKLLTAAGAAAQKLGLPALSQGVTKRRSTFKTLVTLAANQRAVDERLRKDPGDSEANGEAGLYRLLVLGDLKKGLSLLAKGNSTLPEIARLELTAEGQPADRLPLAKAWKAAVEEGSPWHTGCLAQAQYWLRRASATLAGRSDPAVAALSAELRGVTVLNTARLKLGLRAVLYNGADFQYPRVRRVDASVGVNCGEGPPAPGVAGDHFSIRFSGWLLPAVAGKYVIQTSSDDSVRLRIDDKLLIDHWGRGTGDKSVEVELTDAPHRVVVEFNDYGGPANLLLQWSLKDSSTEHLLPADALFHDPALE